MKKLTGVLAILTTIFVVKIAAQKTICFENKGLKEIRRISFELEGNKIVEGNYETIGYDTSTSAETFEFSGAKSGKILKIKFAGTIPYERPPGAKLIVWTLGKSFLIVPTYGKNYNTNRFSTYQAKFEKCTE